MLGLDTNVLVRFLVRDHEMQFQKAQRLIQREVGSGRPVFVSMLVLLEAEWVLRSRYQLEKSAMAATISAMLDTTGFQFEDEAATEEALYLWKDNAVEFADCLIGAHHRRQGCLATATLDAKAAKLPGFVLV